MNVLLLYKSNKINKRELVLTVIVRYAESIIGNAI